MRRFGVLAILIGGLFGSISCGSKKMPEGDLVYLSLTRNGTMAHSEFDGTAEQDSTGAFVLRATKRPYGPLFEKKIHPEIMARFRQIIEEEKMYKYKEQYRPMFQVYDGYTWSFYAKFSDGSSIRSGGSNARPSGNGLSRIRGLMTDLVQSGDQIEFREGDEEEE